MQKSSKHTEEEEGLLSNFLGGLDKSLPPAATPQHTLVDATNFYYNLKNGYIMTRPGLKRYSANAVPAGINGIVEFPVGASDITVVTCEDGKAYYLDGTKSFIEVGSLTGSERPSFSRLGAKLSIASGARLQNWDGNTGAPALSTVASSPNLSYISDHAKEDVARIVGCGPDNLDRIYLSGSRDPENWTFPGATESDAKYIDVGYQDGLQLVAIGEYRGNVFSFKRTRTASSKAVYRSDINDDSSQWWTKRLTRYHGMLSPHFMAEIGGDLFFVDLEGPKNLKAVESFSEFPFDIKPVGQVVSGEMRQYLETDGFIIIDPKYALAMVKPTKNSDNFYCLDVLHNRWTYFQYELNILSGAYCSGTMLFGASDGYLYEYDESSDKDNGVSYTRSLETKWVNPHKTRQVLVKDKYIDILGITAGNITFGVKVKGGPRYSKNYDYTQMWWDWTTVNGVTPEEWTEELDKPFFTTIQDKTPVDGNYISFTIAVNEGLCAIHELRARMALTGKLAGYNRTT